MERECHTSSMSNSGYGTVKSKVAAQLWPVAAADSCSSLGCSLRDASLTYRQTSGADNVYFSTSCYVITQIWLHCVVLLAIYFSFSVFIWYFLNMLCCTWGCQESQVHTAQMGRKTPIEGPYYSLRVVITKKCYLLFSKVVICRVGTFLLFNIAKFSIKRVFWSDRVLNSSQSKHGAHSPG